MIRAHFYKERKMKPYLFLLILSVCAFNSNAELKAMAGDDMDSILSNTGEFTQVHVKHRTEIIASFDVGSSNGRLSNCSNRAPRKHASFYPCWNGQSAEFYSKLNYAVKSESGEKSTTKTKFTFNLNKNGRIENIKIKGINNAASKRQLESLLKQMEFGLGKRSSERVVLGIVTKFD